jgi:hypothetical protein
MLLLNTVVICCQRIWFAIAKHICYTLLVNLIRYCQSQLLYLVNRFDTLLITHSLYAVNGFDTLLPNTVVICCEWVWYATAKHSCYFANSFDTLLLNTVLYVVIWYDMLLLNSVVLCCEWVRYATAKHSCYMLWMILIRYCKTQLLYLWMDFIR